MCVIHQNVYGKTFVLYSSMVDCHPILFYLDAKTIWVYKLDGYVIGALELCKEIEVLKLAKLNF
jgi:hypothetical protein